MKGFTGGDRMYVAIVLMSPIGSNRNKQNTRLQMGRVGTWTETGRKRKPAAFRLCTRDSKANVVLHPCFDELQTPVAPQI